MKMMKRIIGAAVVVAMVCAMAGCSMNKDNDNGNSSGTATAGSDEKVIATAENVTAGKVTKTGLNALSPVHFAVPDPDNAAGLSTKGVGYGFGKASGGKPHQISIDNQKYFDKFDAFCLDRKSEARGEKVLYLTFDCGYENGYTKPILDTLKEKKVPAAFFVTLDYLKSDEGSDMTVRMIKEGHIVGNHSTTHPIFPEISRTEMAKEIETCDNYLREEFGYTSPYFRFPTGEYSDSALNLVGGIGYTSVFWSLAYLDYDTEKQPDPDEAFKTITDRLHPGAVILLHSVSSTNAQILGNVIDYAREQGYVFRSLNEFPKN